MCAKVAQVFLYRNILSCFLKMCVLRFYIVIVVHSTLKENISVWALFWLFQWKISHLEVTWNYELHGPPVSAPSLYIILKSFRESNWYLQIPRTMARYDASQAPLHSRLAALQNLPMLSLVADQRKANCSPILLLAKDPFFPPKLTINLGVCLLVCLSQTVITNLLEQRTWWVSQYPWKENYRSKGQAQKRQEAPCHNNAIQIWISECLRSMGCPRRDMWACTLGVVQPSLFPCWIPSPWSAMRGFQDWEPCPVRWS